MVYGIKILVSANTFGVTAGPASPESQLLRRSIIIYRYFCFCHTSTEQEQGFTSASNNSDITKIMSIANNLQLIL